MADPASFSLAAVLARLVCPVCHGGLRGEGDEVLCEGCGRRYPVRDGIPVLIAGSPESSGAMR